MGRAVVIAAVNQGIHYARLLAEAVRLLMIVLVLAMALEQLQVAPVIVVAAFSIIFGGIVLALAIAFGIGGHRCRKEDDREGSRGQKGKTPRNRSTTFRTAMADFYQTGVITTLHKLGTSSLERLEMELQSHVRTRPLTLVLPALYSEFEGRAMPASSRSWPR